MFPIAGRPLRRHPRLRGSDGQRVRRTHRLDSDGDGFTNLEEFRALTFPGWAASHPPVAP